MASVLSQIRNLNGLGNRAIAEPFAGGAGAALTLLYLEATPDIYINDADPAIHDFWWAVVSRQRAFLRLLADTPVNMKEWHRQREVYRSRSCRSRLRRGFAALYLNRCNHSGILINGGPIGGLRQKGKWRIDARYNKDTLRARVEKIAEYRGRIRVSGLDGMQFIDTLDSESTFFFIDPPYFQKGDQLYLNSLNADYHSGLAERLKSLSKAAWVLTYDDCPEVRKFYAGWAAVRPFELRYVAAERRSGRELIITPKWMRLPTTQTSGAIDWRPA
jgi:DNA adenine methylase